MAKETGRGPADALSKSDRRRKRQQQRSKAIRFEELEHCGEVDAEVLRNKVGGDGGGPTGTLTAGTGKTWAKPLGNVAGRGRGRGAGATYG